MKPRSLLIGWLILIIIALGAIGVKVYEVDPYFHYHKPNLEKYFYSLNNQRSQNDGITKHFDYDALITGTSMTENFKTSEMDKIFDVNSIKVPYSGGSYKEINDNLIVALKYNPKLKTIVRGVDMGKFFDDSNAIRTDLGTYPTYLYDSNPFNDVKYLFNRDVLWGRVYQMMVENDKPDFKPGITAFDDYSRWEYPDADTFGKNTVCPDGITEPIKVEAIHLTDLEKKTIKNNVKKNITSLADNYPNVSFYYFFPPYSAIWWRSLVANGTIDKQIEAEKYIIELILEHPNIRLYSFNNRADITTNLNNYKDDLHYGPWVNSLMLKWMHDGDYLLTKENYANYLEKEYTFYSTFTYCSINAQDDYECDFYAAALLNEELCLPNGLP